MPQNFAIESGPYGIEALAFLQNKASFTDFYACEPPTFTEYEPRLSCHVSHLLGMGVVFNILNLVAKQEKAAFRANFWHLFG